MKKIILGSSMLLVASAAFAGTASETYFELGVGYGNFRRDGDSVADTNVWRGVFNYTLAGDAPVLIADIRSTLEYAKDHSNDEDYFVGNVEAVLGVSALNVLKAYAFAGPEVQNFHGFNALPEKYSGENWEIGLTYGAAVEVEIIPDLLHITPYARFSTVGDMERNRYGLDVSFWLTWFGVGADVNFQDFRGEADAENWQACVYAGFRF